MENVRFIEVDAGVRYWEDASIDGQEDTEGKIPLRNGDEWCPKIDIFTGRVDGWPDGVSADIHYKVCDAGEYWLLDDKKARVAKWCGYYVPDDFLCVDGRGYGDYIILKIGKDGVIENWKTPAIDEEKWFSV